MLLCYCILNYLWTVITKTTFENENFQKIIKTICTRYPEKHIFKLQYQFEEDLLMLTGISKGITIMIPKVIT